MIIIACVDQANGMTFNHRRQSRDSAVIKDILRQTQEKILWMSPYSYGLFSGNLEKENLIQVEEQLLGRVGKGEYCFMEDFPQGDEEDIEGVILYRWDKTYPAETRFPLDLQAPPWCCSSRESFSGTSHEKITKEIYQKIEKDCPKGEEK